MVVLSVVLICGNTLMRGGIKEIVTDMMAVCFVANFDVAFAHFIAVKSNLKLDMELSEEIGIKWGFLSVFFNMLNAVFSYLNNRFGKCVSLNSIQTVGESKIW